MCTLGPNGRNVVIGSQALPQSTKDGVTVAKVITVEGNIQDLGVQLVKQAAMKTADKAGDGTTTSTLLAREMIKEGLQHLDNNENAVEIKRSIDVAVKQVIANIRENLSEDISLEEQLEQVATISANNDVEVGKLIATAIDKVGKDGVIHIEESKSGETYLETVEGMQFDRGYKSHFFVTNNNNMTCTLEDPYILIADHKFTAVKELLPILEGVSNTNKSLLIIAEDIDNEALATLIVNKARGTIKVAAVKAPDFGDRRKLILEDIATLTGGQVYDKSKGMKLDKFSWDWFGSARTVTMTKDQTTIVDGTGDKDEITRRVEELQSQIESSDTPFEKENLQNRLAKMVGGVSIIHVGGYTETEMREKKDRVDDALNATKANMDLGTEIVYKACGKPFEQILVNAGWDSTQAMMLGENELLNSGNDMWTGYNLKKGEIVDMRDDGIIDPAKVTRTALENAAAVAGTVLLTECVVVEHPDANHIPDAMGQMPF